MRALAQRWSNGSIASMAIAAAAVGGLTFAGPASAQMNRGDAQRGHELAERVCTACHIVSPNSARTVNPDVPTFAAIARKKDVTAEYLAGRIIVPHPAMPRTHLTVAEIRDVVAYILSLKPAQ
jgi:cytochrome c